MRLENVGVYGNKPDAAEELSPPTGAISDYSSKAQPYKGHYEGNNGDGGESCERIIAKKGERESYGGGINACTECGRKDSRYRWRDSRVDVFVLIDRLISECACY